MIGQRSGGHENSGFFTEGFGESYFQLRHGPAQGVTIRVHPGVRLKPRQSPHLLVRRNRFSITPKDDGGISFI